MTDILDRLKRWASIQADGSQLGADLREGVAEIERHRAAVDDKSSDIATLQQALSDKDDEIEQLRGAAGAVSAGPDLAHIKADMAKPKPPARPVDDPDLDDAVKGRVLTESAP